MTAGLICARCQRPLKADDTVTIVVDSASGARPNQHTHRDGDPACRRITAAERDGR